MIKSESRRRGEEEETKTVVGKKVLLKKVPSLGNFICEFFQSFREHIKLTFLKSFRGIAANGSWQLDTHHIRMGLLGTWVDKSQQD